MFLQHTDQLLVKLQDRIADLRGIENDEAVTKEVGLAKEAMKDADKLKQVFELLLVQC